MACFLCSLHFGAFRQPSAVWFYGLAGALRPTTFKDLLVSSQDSKLILLKQPDAPKAHQEFQFKDGRYKVRPLIPGDCGFHLSYAGGVAQGRRSLLACAA